MTEMLKREKYTLNLSQLSDVIYTNLFPDCSFLSQYFP